MNYTEVWNRIVKKLQIERQINSYHPYDEAVVRLGLNEEEQILLCTLWGLEAAKGNGIPVEEFPAVYQALTGTELESIYDLPEWMYEVSGQIVLSPVLFGWLEGELPKLPSGAELLLPKRASAYGLDELFADAERIFESMHVSESPAALCLNGEKGSGRQYAMEQICARQDLALLLIDGDRFKGTERELHACTLCAQLYEAFLCVRLGKEVREKLLRDLYTVFHFYGIIKDESRVLEEYPEAAVYMRKLTNPDRNLKNQIAREVLGEWEDKLPAQMNLQQLTGRQLPIGQYLRYLHNIKAELRAGTIRAEKMTEPMVSSHLHQIPATRTFDELKLPSAQYGQLRQICQMAAAREDVMSQWGFGDKFSYGNGMSVLFYGAPGTGKTMAAQVMAHELGMPLYRVDLSQLISKYIGETQKNIGRIFDEADKCDCILLFDEADAIFAKRSDVSDAQDRYSNAETAYLLQRIEQYAGVSILATNLLQNFDDAFRRRISYMVHFPMPDVSLRKELWETIFPVQTPVSPEVDALMLAQAFELSGASIKNAAMHGALLAMAEGSEVRMKHILSGIRNEYGKQGKSFGSSQKELLDAFI